MTHNSIDDSQIVGTVDESNDQHIAFARANVDIVAGLEFIATMQLRTPLRVLSRHGELHPDINAPVPKIAEEMWEGMWVIKTKSFRDLGIDFPDFEPGGMATDIGPIDGGIDRYLSFLRAVRECIEPYSPIVSRVRALRSLLNKSDFEEFVARHGGPESIIVKFFPFFVDTIPSLAAPVVLELRRRRLTTPKKILNADDAALLSIKGVGPAKLKAIRNHCEKYSQTPDAERIDLVAR